MSDDLISRKSLIENLNKFAPEHYTALVNDLIMKEPTAFNKEKVMAELYKKYNKLTDIYNVDKKYDPYCASKFIMNAYKDAIEIVEKGGKTEDVVKIRQVYEKLK